MAPTAASAASAAASSVARSASAARRSASAVVAWRSALVRSRTAASSRVLGVLGVLGGGGQQHLAGGHGADHDLVIAGRRHAVAHVAGGAEAAVLLALVVEDGAGAIALGGGARFELAGLTSGLEGLGGHCLGGHDPVDRSGETLHRRSDGLGRVDRTRRRCGHQRGHGHDERHGDGADPAWTRQVTARARGGAEHHPPILGSRGVRVESSGWTAVDEFVNGAGAALRPDVGKREPVLYG